MSTLKNLNKMDVEIKFELRANPEYKKVREIRNPSVPVVDRKKLNLIEEVMKLKESKKDAGRKSYVHVHMTFFVKFLLF